MTFSIEEAARTHSHRVALIAGGRMLTFADVAREARAMREDGRIVEGACEPLIGHADTPTLFKLYALLETRTPFLAIHPKLTEHERSSLVQNARTSREKNRRIDVRTLAVLFTSGTTGTPRGAVLSRSAFAASARASAQNLPWKDEDRWLLCMPLAHVGGLSIVTRSLAARTCVVLHERFDVDRVLASIVQDHITRISVVPTMLYDLLDKDRDNVLAKLDTVLVGGAATPPSLLEECGRRRIRALTTYGLTEACSQVTTQAPRDGRDARAGSGRPLSGVEVTIVGAEGMPMKAGEIGSISIRGPQMMDGYLGEAPLAGRAFDTGDLGRLDERGELHVATRTRDLIVTGGENVYPIEVENALASCPGVAGAIVFGVAHDRWGHEVCAAVVASSAFDEARVKIELGQKLASFKIPKRIATTDAFPLAANGKIVRAEVVRRFTPALRPWRNP